MPPEVFSASSREKKKKKDAGKRDGYPMSYQFEFSVVSSRRECANLGAGASTSSSTLGAWRFGSDKAAGPPRSLN